MIIVPASPLAQYVFEQKKNLAKNHPEDCTCPLCKAKIVKEADQVATPSTSNTVANTTSSTLPKQPKDEAFKKVRNKVQSDYSSPKNVTEEEELEEHIKGWKNAHSDIAKFRKDQADSQKTVHLHRLNANGKESGMHDARKPFSTEDEAREHHKKMRELNPKSNIRHNLYVGGEHKGILGEEEVNELSKQLITQYKKTAEADKEMQKSAFFGNKKTEEKREKGIKMADKKLNKEAFATNPMMRGLHFEVRSPAKQVVLEHRDPYVDTHIEQEAHHRKQHLFHKERYKALDTGRDESSRGHSYHYRMAAYHEEVANALAKLNAHNKKAV